MNLFPSPKKHTGFLTPINGIKIDCPTPAAAAFFTQAGFPVAQGGVYLRTERLDPEACWVAELGRIEPELYKIDASIEDNQPTVLVRHGSSAALRHALETLRAIFEKEQFFSGHIEDYPAFQRRGIIEGFYGPYWTPEVRRTVISDMARHKMNYYIYAPKDDPYHRERWDRLYDQKGLDALGVLVDLCSRHEIHFCYALGPGLSMAYSRSTHVEKLIAKYRQIMGLGVRCFGLFFDDIPPQLQHDEDKAVYASLASAHADVAGRAYSFLRGENQSAELFLCPTSYWKMPGAYTQALGRSLDPRIEIFWTGRNICSEELRSPDAAEFARKTRHPPLFWDNYPVNDLEMKHELHIGPYINRDTDLYRFSAGIIANPMEYGQASRIPLATIGDYCWNPTAYDAEESWRNAVSEVCGESLASAFLLFADNSRHSCLRPEESPELRRALDQFSFEQIQGRQDRAARNLKDWLKSYLDAGVQLNQSASDPLLDEIRPWLKKFLAGLELLDDALALILNESDDSLKSLKDRFAEYQQSPTVIFSDVLYPFLETLLKEEQ